LGFEGFPTKQTGKKQSKGTVNLGDGFAKVAYQGAPTSAIIKELSSTGAFRNSSTSNRVNPRKLVAASCRITHYFLASPANAL
jgi:hypothetical protein